MATIVLGSIKEQVEATAPPRALYCDFPLGRPLGEPLDPEFQHRVLESAFRLLEAKEPIIEEYDMSIPDHGDEILACPLPPSSWFNSQGRGYNDVTALGDNIAIVYTGTRHFRH